MSKRFYIVLLILVNFCTFSVGSAQAGSSHVVPASSESDNLYSELDRLDSLIDAHLGKAMETRQVEASAGQTAPILRIPKADTLPVTLSPAPSVQTPPDRLHHTVKASDDLTVQMDELDREIKERVRIKGTYRMSMGVGRNRTFSVNDSNADFHDRDKSYLFGERLHNTYDPAIFSQYAVDIEADVADRLTFYTQLVADPWSYSGISSEVRVPEVQGRDSVTFQLKYWGNNNSLIPQIIRADLRNQMALPTVESASDGKTPAFTLRGINDQNLRYEVPPLDLDFEFRPVRKMWVDYETEDWHMRAFALANQEQVMTTDDPMGLSNTKDFWQPSPWLAEWVPIRRFADDGPGGDPDIQGAIERGHYSDTEAFNAKTSYGEYMTLLRGVSMEYDLGRTYLGAMVASPYDPWDEYQSPNNMPGVIRLKHMLSPQMMVGGLYAFRMGFIDREPDAYNQVISFDGRYWVNPETRFNWQVAGSRDDIDLLSQGTRRSPDGFPRAIEDMAYRAGLEKQLAEPDLDGESTLIVDLTWMGKEFRPQLSNYTSTRDDNFWGKHITFHEYTPDLEYYRIGTGVDIGRYTGRLSLHSNFFEGRLDNLFDVRHVRSTDANSFIENVMRNELTYQVDSKLTAKSFFRWVRLPQTQSGIEPYLTDFLFIKPLNEPSPTLENAAIEQGLDPSRITVAGGLQYRHDAHWTLEGSYTRTNDIPDFPRALQNDVFLANAVRDEEDPNILIDKVQNFLYHQQFYGTPSYEYFSVFKEKIYFSPEENVTFTFHAAQNTYKLWAAIDDMFNHQGVSLDYIANDKVSLFMDYTHSRIADVAHGVASGFTELPYTHHHNLYARLLYALRPASRLNFEYGVFGEGVGQARRTGAPVNAFSVSEFALPTIDTEQLWRVSLEGEF